MILKHWKTDEEIEINTPKELKEFLMLCNPTILSIYKEQLKRLKPDIIVEDCGVGLKLLRRKIDES